MDEIGKIGEKKETDDLSKLWRTPIEEPKDTKAQSPIQAPQDVGQQAPEVGGCEDKCSVGGG
ncbi:MAG: hypothetical protein RDV48_28575 [Candidatus Eremiobacteraeota bacterium]|nr:hypothetical protein [Candidatus Eremiobacteraeota bacterium]